MRTILILAASLLLAFPALADAPAWTLVKDKSTLKFFAIQNGAPVEGQFKDFAADIRFDPNHLDQSSITVTVKTGSVTTASDDVEKYIKAADWLSTEAFPEAVYKTGKITRMPQSENYYADGALTLRGKTMPASLNFQMEHLDDKSAIANGYVTLKRTDFGVGQGAWAKDDVIKDEVRVEFRVIAERK